MDHALDLLDDGRGAALAVVGEPGIGKTRLLSELAARAERRGLLVLAGSAAELERDLPFWVFVDAIEEFVRGLEPRRLAELDDDVRVELGRVFPALAGLAATAGAALVHERYRAHRAVRELLERLTAIKPLVLVLDDVHWADPASVDLLGALWRRPPDAAVLVAVAMRPRQAPPRLWAALERAHRAGTLARVDVGAFSVEEARQFLGAAVDADVAASLYAESGGNPFYLQQLARAAGSTRVAATRRSGGGRRRGARCGGGGIGGGDGRCCPTVPASCCRAQRSPATRSNPTSPLLRGGGLRRWWRWTRLMSCCASISFAAPRCRAGSGSVTRWCVERCTSRRPPVGDSVRTPDALTCWPPAGLRRPNGRTISNTRRSKATRRRSPRCAKPVRWPRSGHRRAPPSGSVKRSASCRTPRRRTYVSSCSWPGPGC